MGSEGYGSVLSAAGAGVESSKQTNVKIIMMLTEKTAKLLMLRWLRGFKQSVEFNKLPLFCKLPIFHFTPCFRFLNLQHFPMYFAATVKLLLFSYQLLI